MICNILTIIIFLLVILIIMLIIHKQNQTRDTKNNITLVTNSNFTSEKKPDVKGKTQNEIAECFTINDDIQQVYTIMDNNIAINRLIDNLNKNNLPVNLKNYDPNINANKYTNAIKNNIQGINKAMVTIQTENLEKQQQIDKLQGTLIDLKKIINNMENEKVFTKKYSSVKSLNNGMDLGLVNTPNTIYNDPKSNAKIPAYLVTINDGCLSVGTNNYDVYKCNDKNPKQFFKMEHILNPLGYGKNIDSALPINTVNLNSVNYPFVMLKSVNNDNCLTNYHGNLTVQPCYTYESQRWFPLETK